MATVDSTAVPKLKLFNFCDQVAMEFLSGNNALQKQIKHGRHRQRKAGAFTAAAPELYDQTPQAYEDPSGNLMLERVQGI